MDQVVERGAVLGSRVKATHDSGLLTWAAGGKEGALQRLLVRAGEGAEAPGALDPC